MSPRAFDHRPGPGPGLSPSPNVGPRALQKPRALGRGWAWALTHHYCIMINFKWVFQKNDNISIIKDFRSKMGETQFQTNFVQMGVSKTLTSLVYQGFWIQNGGKSISDQFCPNGYFNNFDSISISQMTIIFAR